MNNALHKVINSAEFKRALAFAMFFMPLFSYPLVWARIITGKMPLWGDVQLISFHVSGLLALAVILLYPERLKSMFKKNPSRIWFISILLSSAVGVINQLIFPGTPTLLIAALHTLFMPLAGAALAPELKRAALPCGAITCIILLIFTAAGDRFLTGFTGNWNWNITMLCATIPALNALILPKKHQIIASGIISGAIIVSIFVFLPDIAPKGTAVALLIASILTPAIRRINRERRSTALVGIALAVGFLFFSTISAPIASQVNDSRFQLWRSSAAMVKKKLITGCGPGRFEQAIRPYMTKEYFFSPYAATRHTHPHNEFLFNISEFGITGAVMLILFAGCVLKKAARKSDNTSIWLTWLFILLFMHGQVDVLLQTPLASTWFLLAGGILSAQGITKSRVEYFNLRVILAVAAAAAAIIFAFKIFSAGLDLRKGKLLLLQKKPIEAIYYLKRSTEKFSTPENHYITATVALFNLKRPDIAIREFVNIENKFCGGYLHSYGLTARALTALGNYNEAKEYFALEREAFPFSALYAGFELASLQQAKASSEEIAAARERFRKNLELRGLSIANSAILHRQSDLDDMPLKWSKIK